MSGWPAMPVILEINSWPWLADLERRFDRPLTLAEVPGTVWDEMAGRGIDALWLMGVWERSPAGLAIARADPGLAGSLRAAVPDLAPGDVAGSPYSVRRYRVDERLGGPAGLAAARTELARRDLRLILDFVPNHVAPDHPAVAERPEWFIAGTPERLAADPGGWYAAGGRVLARGRDPFFPAWPDVLQLNAFHPAVRQATVDTLGTIAGQCDGVRCDMAMLFVNEIFERTWGELVGPAPDEEFWPPVIGRVRAEHPGFLLLAEAYWDTEYLLQRQGFDFCYDKRLYDRLAHEDAGAVRQHLAADPAYQRRLVRFLENHDEPRAATAFPADRHRAAVVCVATLPGATMWHEGQFEGRRVRLPVFLTRRPDEPVDEELAGFYRRLLAVAPAVRRGDWLALDVRGWPDDPTHRDVLAWAWRGDGDPGHLVAVNLSGHRSYARIPLPWPGVAGRAWRLTDLLDGRVFHRQGDELREPGLYVDLPAWGSHVLRLAPG